MANKDFYERIKKHIDMEVEKTADSIKINNLSNAFQHLERAHVLGQSITTEHTRIHWLMLRIDWRQRNFRGIFGQLLRIIGASTKTPFGIYSSGNTGGTNIWFYEPLPIPDDLQKIIDEAKN